MIRAFWAFIRWTLAIITTAIAGALVATAPVAAQAQSNNVTASDLFNGSTTSSFQNATSQFQQGSISNDGGTVNGNILRQAPADSTLVVTSGPSNPSTPTTSNNNDRTVAIWLWIIVVISIIGLVAVYLYNKRNTKQQNVAEAAFAEEVIEEIEPVQDQQKITTKKKSKQSSKKKKSKKHHR